MVTSLAVQAGDTVAAGALLATLDPRDARRAAAATGPETADPGQIRPDLAETLDRHRIGGDEARSAAVGKRHAAGRATARE